MLPKISLLVLIVILGGALRFYNLSGRATFEWDQSRDHETVASLINQKKPTLVGPVIQGQGGFMLGPLYYYLLIPTHLLMSGNPISQPLTSIIIDLTLIVALFILGNRLSRPPTGLILAGLWCFSTYSISLSIVSWNVSLIPLYTLGSLSLGMQLTHHFRLRYFFLAVFWFGLAWHIHPSVIFQIPLALWLTRTNLRLFSPKTLSLALIVLVAPILPWLAFDLRHDFTNLRLLSDFFASSSLPGSLPKTLSSIWQKYAFELSQLIFGRQLFFVGTILILAQFIYLLFTTHFLSKFLKYNLLFSFLALILMRNPDFGNYYLLNILIINLYLLAQILASLPTHYRIFLFGLFLFINISQYRFATQPFSLAIKSQVLEEIAAWKNPVDLEISLPVGRRSAFDWYLAHESTLDHQDTAQDVAYIVESDELEVTAPEKARSVVIEKTIGGFRFVGYEHNP